MGNGIDCFPLCTNLNDKVKLIEAEFGLTGFGVIVKLFQKIYGQQGYYVEFTREVALLFAKQIGVGGNVVLEIVNASIKQGIFDGSLYEKYRILTSESIQKRYFALVSRRKNVTVRDEFLLLSVDKNGKNAGKTTENECIFDKNVCKNTKNVNILQQKENTPFSPNKKKRQTKEKYNPKTPVRKNISISASACTRESNPLSDFIEKYNMEVDLKTVGLLDGIDFKEVSAAFEKSTYLKDRAKSLQWVVNNYSKIKSGFYSDNIPVKKSGYVEIKSKAEDIAAAFER